MQITHSPTGPKEEGTGAQAEVRRGRRRPQIKRPQEEPRSQQDPTRAEAGARLTSGLPRLWPPIRQLGALLGAQHAQPCGRPVHQRGGHSVWRGPGVGGQRLPHVACKEEVCHRYAPPHPAAAPPWSRAPCFCQGAGGGGGVGAFGKVGGRWALEAQVGGLKWGGVAGPQWEGSGRAPVGCPRQDPRQEARSLTATRLPAHSPAATGAAGAHGAPGRVNYRGALRKIGRSQGRGKGSPLFLPAHGATRTGMYLVSC